MYNYVQFQAEGGPCGGFVELVQTDAPVEYKTDSLLVNVSIDDIDATFAKIVSLGGKMLMLKTEIPHVGWRGVFSDPTGNRVALYTSARHEARIIFSCCWVSSPTLPEHDRMPVFVLLRAVFLRKD
jgi:predicted enzyme related to lactoylglutathione lyase